MSVMPGLALAMMVALPLMWMSSSVEAILSRVLRAPPFSFSGLHTHPTPHEHDNRGEERKIGKASRAR
jgi:hypothetical protein